MGSERSPSNDEVMGFLLAHRFATPWRGRGRTRPEMPSTPWRLAAATVTVGGALLGAALAMTAGWTPLRWAVIGAIVGFVVGMYAVETLWERRDPSDHGGGPIGPRI